MEIRKEWGFVSVQIDYNPYYVEQLKLLGGKWQTKEKVWHLAPSQYEAVVELFERNQPIQKAPVEKEARIQDVIDDLR